MINSTGLRELLKSGDITCDPIFDTQISIGSIDVRLDRYIQKAVSTDIKGKYDFVLSEDGTVKVLHQSISYYKFDLVDKGYSLSPGEFVLASTIEKIGQRSLEYQSRIVGKSTLARCGLAIEAAGKIEAGNVLQVTMEIRNIGNVPVCLRYGMQIAQIEWEPVIGASPVGYSGKYLNTTGIGLPK